MRKIIKSCDHLIVIFNNFVYFVICKEGRTYFSKIKVNKIRKMW